VADPAEDVRGKILPAAGLRTPAVREFGTVPAINISNDGRSCESVENSSFQILDLASTGDHIDRLDRLDLVFVQHCSGYTPASFGEIRVNEPNTTVSAQRLRWPDTEPGQAAASAPVLVRNTTAGSASIGAPKFSNKAFSVVHNGCPATLAAGATCQLQLGFTPAARGQFTGVAQIPISDSLNSIILAGSTGSGTSAVHIDGFVDPVDGAGGYYVFTSANANIRFNGSDNRISVGLYAANGPWFVVITPPTGTALTPGTYGTQRAATATDFGLDVNGQGRGCNQSSGTVTIRQLQLASGDHSMTHLDAVFSEQCTGQTSTLRGEVEFESTAPASPPIGTSFAYAASSRHGTVAYLNGLVKQGELGGRLPRSPGRTVYLQRVLAGQWQTMLSRTTDQNGALAIGFVQSVHFTYRWVGIGNSRFTGGRSATTTP
jgi:hypothetical protein